MDGEVAYMLEGRRGSTRNEVAGAMTDETGTKQARVAEAARRALAEAEERRRRAAEAERPAEINGPKGPEPTRYGDWERKGIVSDF